MKRGASLVCLSVFFSMLLPAWALGQSQRWPESEANAWYAGQPWLVGSNYVPADAINQLEMWQAATFDPQRIETELGWAEGLGMNTMRVFLHDLLWQQDAAGFKRRIEVFLGIANKHHIHPIFVLFDSCWEEVPKLGPQHPPIPGVHNSGWVQSPGVPALKDPSQYPRLKDYVQGVVSAFGKDKRILAWDVWNEPANTPEVVALLPQVFAWAREAHPSQPLTSGVVYDDSAKADFAAGPGVVETQIAQSDLLSFHNYGWPENFERSVIELQKYQRPVICTEYMARSVGSTFDTVLPIAKKYHVGAINWGFVVGKTQTNLPWDSWERPYVKTEPRVWFHDVLRADGKPYREREAAILRELTGVKAQ